MVQSCNTHVVVDVRGEECEGMRDSRARMTEVGRTEVKEEGVVKIKL